MEKRCHYRILENNHERVSSSFEYKSRVKEAAAKEIPDLLDLPPEKQFEILKTWTSPNKPRITNYLGECFLKIATHLSYKPNFVNYMFKDDMVCDGIENCVQYINNFDPAKSSNPFAYFTQIIHYAFLRRIQREKRQLEIKNKISWAIWIWKRSCGMIISLTVVTIQDYNSIKITRQASSACVIDEGCHYHRSTFRCSKELETLFLWLFLKFCNDIFSIFPKKTVSLLSLIWEIPLIIVPVLISIACLP